MKEDKKLKEHVYKIKDIPLYYLTPFETIQGMINGVDRDKVEDLYKSIDKCTCGGNPIGIQTECMGDFDFEVHCDNPNCDRYILKSMYDYDVTEESNEIDLAIKAWNFGYNQDLIEKMKKDHHEQIRIKPEDLIWKPVYANHLLGNPIEGIYCILNINFNNKIYACKWTILYQYKEISPMCISRDREVDMYILYMNRYMDLDEPLVYPEPLEDKSFYEVNNYGDFIRAYRTLDEVKEGAIERCGWQRINQNTLIKE